MPASSTGVPSVPSMLWRQIRAQNRIFWRTPIGAFFTLVLPVLMLVLFVALFGNDSLEQIASGDVKTAQFYVPGLGVFAAASATYTNVGNNLSLRRDERILKRVRGTPLPPWVYLAGVVLSAVWIALFANLIMLGLGVFVYDVNVELAKASAMLITFVVGSLSFALLGVALASVAGSASATPAVANATIIPLSFVSSVFISFDNDIPRWLEVIGDVFPLKPFAVSMQEAMSPFSEAPALDGGRLAVIVAWGVAGAVVAWRRFAWEPVRDRSGSRGRRARSGAGSG